MFLKVLEIALCALGLGVLAFSRHFSRWVRATVALVILVLCTIFAQGAEVADEEKPDVVIFTAHYCGHCQRFKREYLPQLKKQFNGKVRFVEYEITEPGVNMIFNDTLDEYGETEKGVPALVVGKTLLMGYPASIRTKGEDAINKAIKNKEKTFFGTKDFIAQCKSPAPKTTVNKPVDTPEVSVENTQEASEKTPGALEQPAEAITLQEPCEPNLPDGTSAAREMFNQITFVAIIAAGLIDGINPCAFAVIVFFISFLAAYKYNRREVILVGSAYCFSVFLAYVLIGLGLFNFVYAMRSFYYVMMGFKWLTIILCGAFLVFSLYDFIIYTITKNHNKIILQLSKSNKEYIHKVMRFFLKDKQSSAWRLVLAAVCVGFVVSLVEAICTGQVYLPTIALILKEAGEHFWRAMAYLILYNLMFIVPLIVILVLSVLGYESSTFNGFFKKHLGLTKLLLCLLFLGLLLLLIFNI